MTPTEAKACAEFLDKSFEAVHRYYYDPDGWRLRRLGVVLKDDESFYALLLRARELEMHVQIELAGRSKRCDVLFGQMKPPHSFFPGTGPTPLGAMVAAVCRYMEGKK